MPGLSSLPRALLGRVLTQSQEVIGTAWHFGTQGLKKNEIKARIMASDTLLYSFDTHN